MKEEMKEELKKKRNYKRDAKMKYASRFNFWNNTF